MGLAAAVVVLVLIPAIAGGDVLVNAVEPTNVACGKSVTLGVWCRSFSGGSAVGPHDHQEQPRLGGLAQECAATTSWRYWHYTGNCAAGYVVVYNAAGGPAGFLFRVTGA